MEKKEKKGDRRETGEKRERQRQRRERQKRTIYNIFKEENDNCEVVKTYSANLKVSKSGRLKLELKM